MARSDSHRTLRVRALLHHRGGFAQQRACALACAKAFPHRELHEEEGVPHSLRGYVHLRRVDNGGTHIHVPQLLPHGLQAAHRVRLAAVRHLLLATCASAGRPDKERIPHLHPRDAHVVHRHHIPHNVHPQQPGDAHLPAHTACVHPLAMERDTPPQPQHPALRHLLHLDFAAAHGLLHRLCPLRLRAAGCAGAHLVDVPAQLHTDHHLRLRLPRSVRAPLAVAQDSLGKGGHQGQARLAAERH